MHTHDTHAAYKGAYPLKHNSQPRVHTYFLCFSSFHTELGLLEQGVWGSRRFSPRPLVLFPSTELLRQSPLSLRRDPHRKPTQGHSRCERCPAAKSSEGHKCYTEAWGGAWEAVSLSPGPPWVRGCQPQPGSRRNKSLWDFRSTLPLLHSGREQTASAGKGG